MTIAPYKNSLKIIGNYSAKKANWPVFSATKSKPE